MFHLKKLSSRAMLSDLISHSLLCRISQCPFAAGGPHTPNKALYGQNILSTFNQGFGHSLYDFTTFSRTILVRARDTGKFHEDLETAIGENRLEDAWDLHEQQIRVEGFARKSVFCKLIAKLTESSDIDWIKKAYGLAEKAFEENKQTLFDRETLIYLSLGLAKFGLPIQACTILRKLVEMENFPPVAAWSAIMAHMSINPSGAYLSAELVLEIGYLFQDGRVDPRKKCNGPLLSMKPSPTAFNIALVGCLLFGSTRKAEQLLDMIPRINMKPDATTLIVMAHIFERNGRRDELKKLRRHIDEVPSIRDAQIRQFYDCLLSCHLKFGDLDSASNMVLEMLRKEKKARNSLGLANLVFDDDKRDSMHTSHSQDVSSQYSCGMKPYNKPVNGSDFLCYEEFYSDRKFSRLEAETKKMLESLVDKLHGRVLLVTTERGILKPTKRTYMKLVRSYLEAGKIKDLVEFLTKMEKEDSPMSADSSILFHIINSCISFGWLDKAHDLLDEMRLAGIRTSPSVYNSLLKAYHRENRANEMKSLIRDARRAGMQLDATSYESLIESRVLEKDTSGALSLFKEMKEAKIPPRHRWNDSKEDHIMSELVQEIKGEEPSNTAIHDWNNVIHFFCKRRLMQDAEKALKKMRSLGHAPNAQTFHSMVTGYAAVGGKYVEVAELWGEMKSIASASGMKFDMELLDALLYNFVRGGFFVRANEIAGLMEEGGMFVDKYKYRALFLKYHKTLYKGKAPKVQTESQLRKRESALAFKRWVGL